MDKLTPFPVVPDSVLAALDKPGLQIERVKELQRMDPSLVDIIYQLL